MNTQGTSESEIEASMENQIASITISSRIPEFWADQTRLWFVQFEAAVESQRLSDAAKQNLVVTKLTKTAIQQVSDILLAAPETRKYQTLKERLFQVFEESETRKLQKLISEMDLGDQRPSQLLRRMRELARDKVPDDTLKLMWQSHLPTSVRAILSVTDSKDLDVLATIADKVLENTSSTAQVAEVKVRESRDTAVPISDIDMIRSELARINIRLKNLERGSNTHFVNERRSRPTSRSGSMAGRRKTDNWVCFYHYRYKEKATKCVQPCSWSSNQATAPEN